MSAADLGRSAAAGAKCQAAEAANQKQAEGD